MWIACLVMAFCPMVAAAEAADRNKDGIRPEQVGGRTIWVNNEEAGVRNSPSASRAMAVRRPTQLVYWSREKQRWIPVSSPSPGSMRAARNAAAEVSSYISARPRTSRDLVNDPGYSNLARGYVVSAREIDDAIDQAAKHNNVDPNLVRAVIKVESNFNPGAVSRKGAMGLMQLMPQTARKLGVSDPYDPRQNVDAGVRHLRSLLETYKGNLSLTLAAYNAGEGAVTRNNGVPPYAETQNYVRRIQDLYWNGRPGRLFTFSATPIHVYRQSDGRMLFTNTD